MDITMVLGLLATAVSLTAIYLNAREQQRKTTRARRNRRRSKATAPVRKARRAARNIRRGVR